MGFFDRREAGERLARELLNYKGQDVVVLAIPRGGVVVAAEVIRALGAPLDLIIPRKIGAPGNPELAIGAVAGESKVMINEALKRSLGVSDEYIEEETAEQLQEIARRRAKYLGTKKPQSLRDKTVIVIDDGLATGYTALAALRAIADDKPAKLILAVPVAPQDTCKRLREEVDELICLEQPAMFFAVGQFYTDFSQTTDEEVIKILNRIKD